MIINVQLRSSRENFIGGRAVSKKQGCFLGAGRYKEVRERSVNPHQRVAKRVFRFGFRFRYLLPSFWEGLGVGFAPLSYHPLSFFNNKKKPLS